LALFYVEACTSHSAVVEVCVMCWL